MLVLLATLAGCAATMPSPNPQMLDGCVRSDGVFDYTGACGAEIRWPRMPLRVRSPHEERVRPAVAWWNEQLGFEAFTFAPGFDVFVEADTTAPPDVNYTGGRALHVKINGSLAAFVRTWGVHPENRQTVIRHELGHVLGLAHDEEDPGSLMFRPSTGSR